MKTILPTLSLTDRIFADGACDECQARLAHREEIRSAIADAQTELTAVEPERGARRAWSGAVGWVGLLAIGQSLLFLALLLFFCLAAGAAPAPKEFTPDLQVSSYSPSKARDPFTVRRVKTAPEVKVVPGTPIVFQLQGILYQDENPSAMVNNYLLTLNKVTIMKADDKTVEVRAVEITREKVVLETGGQRVELQLNPQAQAKKDQP